MRFGLQSAILIMAIISALLWVFNPDACAQPVNTVSVASNRTTQGRPGQYQDLKSRTQVIDMTQTTAHESHGSIPTYNKSGTIPFRDYFFNQVPPDWFWQNESPERHWFNPQGKLTFRVGFTATGPYNRLLRPVPDGSYTIICYGDPVGPYRGQEAQLVLYADADNYATLRWDSPYPGSGYFRLRDQGVTRTWRVYDDITYDIGLLALGYIPERNAIHVLLGKKWISASGTVPIDSLFVTSFAPQYIGFEPYGTTGDTLGVPCATFHSFPYVLRPQAEAATRSDSDIIVAWSVNPRYPLSLPYWGYDLTLKKVVETYDGRGDYITVATVNGLPASSSQHVFYGQSCSYGCYFRGYVQHAPPLVPLGDNWYTGPWTVFGDETSSTVLYNCPLDFTYSQVSGTPTVHFASVGGMRTFHLWDFGDGSPQVIAEGPNHSFDVPPCQRRTFEVKHWAGLGQPCGEPVVKLVTVYNSPVAGSSGKAYVIVGDVHMSQKAQSLGIDYSLDMESAAVGAMIRLEEQGYNVERMGSAEYGPWATRADIERAAKDPEVTAIWIVAHGANWAEQASNGQKIYVADGFVTEEEIRTWRAQSGSVLKELTVFSCNGGISPTVRDSWRVGATGEMYAPLNLEHMSTPGIVENARQCDIAPQQGLDATEWAAFGKTVPEPLREAWFLPMLMRLSDGSYADDAYDTIAGSVETVVVNSDGCGLFGNADAGIEGNVSGQSAGDTVQVWMNRFEQSPCDTVPAGKLALGAFYVGGSCAAQGTQLEFGYDAARVPSTESIEAWRFDEAARSFVELVASVDSVGQRVTVVTNNWGSFLLTCERLPVGLEERDDVPQITRLRTSRPNPFNPMTEVLFELQQPGPVRLRVHDVSGRLVRTLVDEPLSAGRHSAEWDGRDENGRAQPSGVYVVRLETRAGVDVSKVTLAK